MKLFLNFTSAASLIIGSFSLLLAPIACEAGTEYPPLEEDSLAEESTTFQKQVALDAQALNQHAAKISKIED